MKNIVLLHGALGSAWQFSELQQLLQQNYNVFAFDFKGHGKRADSMSFTIPELADDLIALLYDNQVHDANIFGYSMGGYVALTAALQQPKLISSIFTLGTKFTWDAASVEKETAMLQPDAMIEKVPAYIEMLKHLHGEYWERLVLNTAAMMKNLSLLPLSEKDFKAIKQPVRIAIGDKDTLVTLEETATIYNWLAKGSMLVIPDTKHPIEKADVERLAYEIKSFVN